MMKKVAAVFVSILLVCTLLAGCTGKPVDPNEKPDFSKTDKTMTCDLVVVGGGGAGLSAALTAAEIGKQVILIEKLEYLGGTAMMSGGIFPAAQTKQQEEAEVYDDPGSFAHDILRNADYSVDAEMVNLAASESAGTLSWLEEQGISFSLITDSQYEGHSTDRLHQAEGGGKAITDALAAQLEKKDNVTVLLSTPATALATDANGAVIGVYAQNETDGNLLIEAKNTLLTTGGFAANEQMIKKYIPEMQNAHLFTSPGSTGEGILWGMQLGAAVDNMHAYQGYGLYSEELDGSIDPYILTRGGILVTSGGIRFVDESIGYSRLAPHILAQPDSYAYLIFDSANAEATEHLEQYRDAGILIEAESIEDLAVAISVDMKGLLSATDGFLDAIVEGKDYLGRTSFPQSFDAPYYAIKVTADLRHTQGGLTTDLTGQVLRDDGTKIEGLYAAGGVTEGFSSAGGPAYCSGNGLLQAFVFGRIAGKAAVG